MPTTATRRIVLTGATRGLGRALAEGFASVGHTVLGCGRSETELGRLRQRFGPPHDFAAVDVADAGQVEAWADRLLAGGGPPDLLVNNAALMSDPAPLWEVPADEFDRLIDVNVKGVANVLRSFVPAMVAAGRGVIVNFSSGWGRSTSPRVAPYCASKFAVEGLTRALAQELPDGLAAVPLNPGIIDTDMLRTCFGADAADYPPRRRVGPAGGAVPAETRPARQRPVAHRARPARGVIAMRPLPRCALFALLAVPPAMALVCGEDRPAPPPVKGTTLYDPDPRHLWNRLHDALRVRLTTARADEEFLPEPEDTPGDADDLDPMLWHSSKYLLTGPADAHYDELVRKSPDLRKFPRKATDAHRAALAVLDEFLARDGEKLVRDPLRRALLQRDLWALFDTLTDPAPMWTLAQSSRYDAPRRALRARLAKILPRLALSAEQIRRLPDTYAEAVKAGDAPAAFDPERPKVPFLPRDLFQPDGHWVLLGQPSDQPLASVHARFFDGRSAFLVFLRLPGGREPTVEYVDRLLRDADQRVQASRQFPPRTQVALVRRALLIDGRGAIVPTRLTETVQVRVYLDPKQQVTQPDGGEAQTFSEHRLRRRDLLAGKAGALSPVGARERERSHLLFLGLGGSDGREAIRTSCRGGHGRPGIESVNSYMGDFRRGGKTPLRATTAAEEEQAMIGWKKGRYTWGLLEGLQARPQR